MDGIRKALSDFPISDNQTLNVVGFVSTPLEKLGGLAQARRKLDSGRENFCPAPARGKGIGDVTASRSMCTTGTEHEMDLGRKILTEPMKRLGIKSFQI
jgi:hypothetical protein